MTGRKPNNRFGPTRLIVQRRRFTTPDHPPGTYSVELLLECGHVVIRKGSQEPYISVHCRACQAAKK